MATKLLFERLDRDICNAIWQSNFLVGCVFHLPSIILEGNVRSLEGLQLSIG